jgi:hypothetical protein
MAGKFLDDTGLSHFWGKIKGKTIPYGYCETGTSTVAKTVTVSPAITSLEEGLVISVKFKNSNTASNPTLNVNSLGAKRIYRYGTTAPSTSAASSWNAGNAFTFIYDGSAWQMAGWMNTTYSSMTVAEYEAGTATTARTITPARLKGAIQHWATGEANVQSDWNQTDDTADDFIKNKPTIPDISGKVNKSGDTMSGDLTFGFANGIVFDSGYITSEIPRRTVKLQYYGTDENGVISLGVTTDPQGVGVRITAISNPKDLADVANKAYVDNGLLYKVDKVNGKGLSTEDYTTAEKTKLAGIATGAEVNVNADWDATSGDAQILNKPTIPTKTSDLTNDSGFITSYTETDPIFTASPAYGITANDITNWNGKSNFSGSYNDLTNKPTIPTDTNQLSNSAGFITLMDAVENNQASTYILMVSGSSSSLYSGDGNPASFYAFAVSYQSVAGARIGQVIGGTAEQPEARVFEVAEVDYQTYSVSLVSVDNGVIYKADLQATDLTSALTGTFSSQTIPTGGITTETDPTVPAWAKASTKPSYGASEISASFPQSHYIDSATNVGGALDTLAYELYGVDQTANAALPKSGGQLTGDLTLYVASGNSPAIIFQRGTLTDNYNDWKIYDKGGYLYFAQRGSGSSSFNDMGYISTTGVLTNFTIPWGSVTSKPTIPTKTSDLTNDSGFLTQHQDISGKVDRFKVTLSYNSSTQEYSVDKTYAEIESAVSANKYVYISDTTETVSSTLGQAHFVIVAPLTLASPQDYWYEFRTVISGANGETTEVFYSLADDGVYVNTGKILINTGLPPVSSSDNGKILRVVSGAWSVVSLPSASGVSF